MDAVEQSQASPQPERQPAAPLPPRRKWLFRIVALTLPLLLLAIIEIACRIAGYGGHPPVLAAVGSLDGKDYVTTIERGIATFFIGSGGQRGSLTRQFFTMPKDANAVRIVIVGGSAAQGYPQPERLKLSSFLQAMLTDLWPQRRVEVVNLGTTAVASFPATCIAKEALNFSPDLLIVYSGNNEFYGAGGVASTYALGRSARAMRVFHALRRLALVQALLSLRKPPVTEGENTNLMDVVIADSQIPPDDPSRQAAADNLAYNLGDIIDACRSHNVPVIVCTCPGNERGLAPIGEDLPPPLADAERERFNALLESGRARTSVAPAEALADLDQAASLDHDHATLHYLRAKCLSALGRDDEAAEAFALARDLDTMPWRTPRRSNQAIRAAARKGAVLCDLERAFRQASPGGAIGWELMDDHVHPALAGQALIARTLLDAMCELPGALKADPAGVAALPDWENYAERLGANPLDAYRVVYRISDLYERSFFRRSNSEALVRYLAMQRRMEADMDALTLAAVRDLQQSRSSKPIAGGVGEAQFLAGRFAEAADNFAFAQGDVPPYSYLLVRFQCLERVARTRASLPLDDAPALADILEQCRVMACLRGWKAPILPAYQGWVLSQAGRRAEAVDLMAPVITRVQDTFLPVLAGELLADLVALDRAAEARAIFAQLAIPLDQLDLDPKVAARLTGKTGVSPP